MKLTQSTVKLIESCCPRYSQYQIETRPDAPPGSNMDKGSFFETLALGSGVQGKETHTLPLLKSGEKSTDHIRIEKQAQRFKDMFDPLHPDFGGRVLHETQVVLTHENLEGTVDFTTNPLIVYDLKLTNDINGYLEGRGFKLITRPKFKQYYEQIQTSEIH